MSPRVIAVVISCAVIAAGVAVWRSGLFTEQSLRREQVAQSQLTQQEFKRVTVAPITVDSISDIQRSWISRLVDADPAIGPQLAEGICEEAAMWLRKRFVNTSPADYRAWRDSLGYRLQDQQKFVLDNGMDVVYPALVHQPLPSSASIEKMFDDCWPSGFTVFGDDSMPIAIAADDVGVAVAITSAPLSQFASRTRLSGQIGAEHWMGYGGATMRSWFTPPFEAASCADQQGNNLIIEVGVVVEYKSGKRRPLVQTFAVSPARDRWILMGVTTYAAETELISALEY